MATWSGFNVSSSPSLRIRSYSVANATQLPFLSPLCRRRLLAERFGLGTIVVSRKDLSVSPPRAAAMEARISGKREPMVPPYNVLITGSTKGMQFVGKPQRNKTLAEKDAAVEALAWLTDNMLKLLGGRRRRSKGK